MWRERSLASEGKQRNFDVMSHVELSLALSFLALSCTARPEPNPPPGPEPVPIAPATPAPTAPESPPLQSSATPEPAASDGPSPMVPTDWTLCEAPADCVLVVTTCCDQCNGGKAVAVNTKHVEETKGMRGSCTGVACTKRGCTTHTNCLNGRCVIEQG